MDSVSHSSRPQAVFAFSTDAFWKSLFFWRMQWPLLSVLIAGVLITILLMPLTTPRNENPLSYLVFLIYPLALWGAYRATWILAEIEIEHSIVAEVERQGSEKLAEIRGDPTRRIDLNHVEETIIPRCGGSITPAMVQMFQHICQDARDHAFESRVTVMHPHREKALAGVLELQNIQKLALRLGILGTFVGLLMAILGLAELVQSTPAISAKLGDDTVDFSKLLHLDQVRFEFIAMKLFDALHISFGTSVAGLEVSVLLGVVVMLLHRRLEAYFSDMEDAAGTMLSLARNAINQDSFFSEFSQIRSAMGQLEERIYQQTQSVSRELHYMAKHLRDQTAGFDVGLERLQAVREEWNSFLEDMQATQRRLVEGVGKSQSAVADSFQGFLRELETSQLRLIKNMQTSQQQLIKGVRASQTTTTEMSQGFLKKLEDSQQQFLDDAQQVLDMLSVGKLGAQLSASIEDVGAGIGSMVQPQLEKLSKEITELTGTNQGLMEANNKLQQRISETQDGLDEIKKSKIAVDRFMKQMTKSHIKFLDDTQSLLSSVAQRKIGEEIRQDLAETGHAFTTATSKYLRSITIEIRKLKQSLAKLTHDTSTLVQYIPRSPIYGLAMWVGILSILSAGGWAFWSLLSDMLR